MNLIHRALIFKNADIPWEGYSKRGYQTLFCFKTNDRKKGFDGYKLDSGRENALWRENMANS